MSPRRRVLPLSVPFILARLQRIVMRDAYLTKVPSGKLPCWSSAFFARSTRFTVSRSQATVYKSFEPQLFHRHQALIGSFLNKIGGCQRVPGIIIPDRCVRAERRLRPCLYSATQCVCKALQESPKYRERSTRRRREKKLRKRSLQLCF